MKQFEITVRNYCGEKEACYIAKAKNISNALTNGYKENPGFKKEISAREV